MSAVVLGEVAALGAAFCWAVAPLLYRQALFDAKPISANIVRLATNAAVLLVALVAFGSWGAFANLPLGVVAFVMASGLIGLGVGDTLYLYGLKTVGVSRAVPLSATYPLFSLVWATLLLGQPVTAIAVTGAVVIVAGIWLLSRERDSDGASGKGKLALAGIAASLAASLSWSVSMTLMDSAMTTPGLGALATNYAIVTIRISTAALFFLLLAPLLDRERGFLKLKRNAIILLCVGGIIANAVGWLLMNYSFLNVVAAQAVPISSITPLFSAFAGFLLFREKATINRVLGAIIVVVGVVLIFLV